jgi:hypothetical protein
MYFRVAICTLTDPSSFLGMLQNILVAGATRRSQAHGIDLRQCELVQGTSVMKVLQDVEDKYPGVGLSLLDMFFPGDLRPDEKTYWAERKKIFQWKKAGGPRVESIKRVSTV